MPIEEYPSHCNIDPRNHEIYKKLSDKNNVASPFQGREFADIFIYSMAIGYHMKIRVPLKKKLGLFLVNVIKNREWILNSIAVAEINSIDVLLRKQEVIRIAEEYANGGIKELEKQILSREPGDVYRRMHADLLELGSNLSKGS